MVRRWVTEGRKRDWRVSFMDLVPEGAVTIGCDGCEGRRALRRNCEQRRLRWSWTGSIWVSECRWPMEAIFRDPVAILRAEFWTLWSLRIPEGGVLGNQMGAVWGDTGLMRVL